MSDSTTATPLDYAFTDKLGRDITFEWHEDCESSNRGFQVDQVIARAGSEKVGFIKVDYVSSQKWKTYYPSGVLNFMSQIDGTSVLHHSEGFTRPATDLKTASPETLNAVAKKLVDHRYSYEKPSQPLENHRQFAAWFKANVTSNKLYKQSLARFQEFKALIDVPKVIYISTSASEHNEVPNDNRRLGIGTMLYKVMAKELDRKGLRLHSSTLQAPEAAEAWRKLSSEGIVYRSRRIGGRLAINPNKFQLELKNTTTLRP